MAAFQSLAVPSAPPVATSLPSGPYPVAKTSPLCPVSLTSFSPVRVSRMLAVPPSRSAATKRDASGAKETTCPMPVLRPTPGTADSTREVAERVVQRLLGFREHRAVVPPRRLRGLDREQDAPLGIDGEVRLRGRRQLTGRREARVVSRLAPRGRARTLRAPRPLRQAARTRPASPAVSAPAAVPPRRPQPAPRPGTRARRR